MVHVKIVSVTSDGAIAAEKLASLLSGNLVERYDRSIDPSLEVTLFSRFVQQAMVDCDMVIFIGSIDETVRLVTPYIANSGYDPVVLSVDEDMTGMRQLFKSRNADVNALAERLAAEAEIVFIARKDLDS